MERSERIEEFPDYEYRWACLAKALPDDSEWPCSSELATVRSAWGAYQRNDTLNYCLECLMGVVLGLLEDGPRRPMSISEQIADMAMAPVAATGEFASMRALPKRVCGELLILGKSVIRHTHPNCRMIWNSPQTGA
jgi:hypothetical protein